MSVAITALYFLLFIGYPKLTHWLSNRLNIALYDNKSTLESVVNDNLDKNIYSIIFDFENHFISSGFVRNVDNQGNYQIGLYDTGGEQALNIDEARSMYAESYKNTVVIDSKNKTKTYLIIS